MTIADPTRPSPSTSRAPRRAAASAEIVQARQPPKRAPTTSQPSATTHVRNDTTPEAQQHVVAQCQAAAADCALVIMAFTHIRLEDLFKSTRGAASEAFPRQLLMAGLVSELGFSSLTVGRAVGRDKATVDHACRIVEALRGGLEAIDLIRMLGEDGVREFLGGVRLLVRYGDDEKPETVLAGGEEVEEFLEHAEGLIDDLFAAFRVVAIKGRAYRDEQERLKREAAARAAT